jgi:hypothetical protein
MMAVAEPGPPSQYRKRVTHPNFQYRGPSVNNRREFSRPVQRGWVKRS